MTQARTSSPRRSSGVGATATSRTIGWRRRTVSTSTAEMFSPLRRIEVFLAVDEMEVAVGVATDDVAGMKPAVAPRLAGRIGIA